MEGDLILYRSCPQGRYEKTNKQKKFEKTRKKFLTNEKLCVRINKLTARAESDTVPCKLNNVKNEL